ncbi:MAG: pyridoxal phosphate-dependent aminotransferase [Marinobacterium sp.]|nr:pyridoxal phosphate-dependent aminotransferase [Marinobacterium sp.]
MLYPASKLPALGTTIFTRMSQLAAEHEAINLSQGFPDFDGPQLLRERVAHYIGQGANQYAPMTGTPQLRQAIAAKVARCYGAEVCAEQEITITCGATEALFAAISAVVRSGDEVILFDPCYDSYQPAIELNGGVTIRLPLLLPDFSIDWSALRGAIGPRTRMIIVNTPHNPTGAVLSDEDLQQLSVLLQGTNILLLGDEVYEHIVFDGLLHQSLLRFPELAERAFVVSSFGKTYHTTGWKVGYCIAPPAMSAELRKVHQYLTFSISTPMQLALADYLQAEPEHDQQLPAFYQQKRDLFNSLLADSRFSFSASAGTYFQLVDYSAISERSDIDFCHWLTTQAGVAAIPLSPFCEQPLEAKLIRLCFAKNTDTLQDAAQRLCQI